jgi:hypothetical protein
MPFFRFQAPFQPLESFLCERVKNDTRGHPEGTVSSRTNVFHIRTRSTSHSEIRLYR